MIYYPLFQTPWQRSQAISAATQHFAILLQKFQAAIAIYFRQPPRMGSGNDYIVSEILFCLYLSTVSQQ